MTLHDSEHHQETSEVLVVVAVRSVVSWVVTPCCLPPLNTYTLTKVEASTSEVSAGIYGCTQFFVKEIQLMLKNIFKVPH